LTAVGGSVSADAIIVAAGSSARMGGADKLLDDIDGRPLLAHTIAAIAAAPGVATIVVVTSPQRQRRLEIGGLLPTDRRVVFTPGGDERHDSVRAGFAALDDAVPDPAGQRVVLVHDGARPLVSIELVAAVIEATDRHGAAIPVVPIADTLKRLVGDRVAATIDRTELGAAQTPQGVRRGILRDALASDVARQGTWTDEAALLEACRIPVHAVPGDPDNLKVTVPADLARATTLLSGLGRGLRTGIGHDAHPFGPGSPLRLGGVDIPGAAQLHGHSDGDVVLHAIADALLGAAGLGDLGRLFPAGPSTPAGVDSRVLLTTVVGRLSDAGWRPVGVDCTVVAARPRLGSHLETMRAAIAEVLGIAVDRVNVKASSGNLDGSEGAGRSISTLALATIETQP
jgi:2-C-methyl-D-erythritol 4-phosphate cytidylyltransferase/2-C-methyl-D-erythritol 2,4-cyclodiphosphate synthase